MPMKADTDNLRVQIYPFAERTILDKAFQDCGHINRNGFEMFPVDMLLIEMVFFQYILQCMQYVVHYFVSEAIQIQLRIVSMVISRHENSDSWFFMQPHSEREEQGFLDFQYLSLWGSSSMLAVFVTYINSAYLKHLFI